MRISDWSSDVCSSDLAVSGPSDVVSEDYNLIPDGVDDEDYNTATGGEDFGADPLNYVNHNLSIIGTLDVQTVFIQEEPKLTLFKTAASYYACPVPGVCHILDMSATRSEDHTSELLSLLCHSYALFCLINYMKNKLLNISNQTSRTYTLSV